ncbi:MAG: hypothetical protein GX446_13100 [Chthonomonadales bacterium]|nr:hypothetical protein [Chthonomonadales bacterium]
MPNQLVQCVSGGNTSQFVYGADGLRRTSIVNGNPVHSVLDSGMMVREPRAEGQELRASTTYLIGPRGPEYRPAKLRAEGQELRASATYLIGPRGPEYRLAKLRAEGQELRADQDSGNRTASARPRHGSVSGCDVYGLVRAGDSATSRHKRRPELVEGFVGSVVAGLIMIVTAVALALCESVDYFGSSDTAYLQGPTRYRPAEVL